MSVRVLEGDCREVLAGLPDASVQCVVTSPPYWGLRDYGVPGQLGLEKTPDEYVAKMVDVFRAVHRVLRDDGTLWLNLGDSYGGDRGNKTAAPDNKHRVLGNGSPSSVVRDFDFRKQLVGIPWRVAFALQADGWFLRSDIIWHKPNPMPESVTDRPTKAHEYLFLLSKSPTYYYDAAAIAEESIHAGRVVEYDGDQKNVTARLDPKMRTRIASTVTVAATRNRRSVWTVATQPYSGAHFATFPPALIEPCILAGSRKGDTVLDPFFGAGTTGIVADRRGRDCIGIELNPEYAQMARERVRNDNPLFTDVA
jgi:DNA modification methylase